MDWFGAPNMCVRVRIQTSENELTISEDYFKDYAIFHVKYVSIAFIFVYEILCVKVSTTFAYFFTR